MSALKWPSVLGAVIVVAATALPGQAAPISFTTRAAFDAALPETVENWESYAPGTIFNNGTTTNGITYSSSSGNAIVHDSWTGTTPTHTLGRSTNGVLDDFADIILPGHTITFSFGTSIGAFGIDALMNTELDGLLKGVTNTGETVFSFYNPFGFSKFQFLGFRTDLPFTSIAVSTVSETNSYVLDTLRYVPFAQLPAAPTSVPEPASLLLVGTGIAAAVRRARQHRRLS